jgi:hypothetical protein
MILISCCRLTENVEPDIENNSDSDIGSTSETGVDYAPAVGVNAFDALTIKKASQAI